MLMHWTIYVEEERENETSNVLSTVGGAKCGCGNYKSIFIVHL